MITSVQYGKVENLGNFENERVTAWANVGEGQSPEEVLSTLRSWVAAQLSDVDDRSKRVRKLEDRQYRLEKNILTLQDRLFRIKVEWERAEPILRAHGIEMGPFPIAPEVAERPALADPSVDKEDEDDSPF
jgi:hypothetical protein